MPKKYLQFGNLAKHKNLTHAIFNKTFGNVSLEWDEKEKVEENKKNIARVLKIDYQKIFSVKQVHGSNIRVLDRKSLKNNPIPEADALLTDQKNIFLMIKTADCFPILMFDPGKKITAAVHVGWRGAIEKNFLNVLLKMAINFKCQPQDVLIAIGPGINPCCFKHKSLIQEKLPQWQKYIQTDKKGWKTLNLLSYIKDQLIDAGVKKANIEAVNICTNCDRRFFSHFRSLQTGEQEGRFASIIGMRND